MQALYFLKSSRREDFTITQKMIDPHTHYDNLQISRNASDAVIRAAYRALSQRYHPDKNLTNAARANRTMKIINEAFEVLSDPLRRAEHDSWIERQKFSQPRRENVEKSDASEYSTAKTYASTKQENSNTVNKKEVDEAKSRFRFYNETTDIYFDTVNSIRPEKKLTERKKIGYLSKQPKYHFYQVTGMGLFIMWSSCRFFPDLGYNGVALLDLVFDIIYFSIVVGSFAFPFAFACIGWIVGKSIHSTRHNPSLVAAAFMIIAETLVIISQFILLR